MAKQPNIVGGVLERIDAYPDHLRAIGLVVTEFGRLEGALCLMFWELIGDPARASAVFWSLGNSKARCDIIRGVAKEVLSGNLLKVRDEALGVVEEARKVSSDRNDIAHGQWGTPHNKGGDPFVSIQRPATKSPIFQRVWTVQQLQDLANRISDAERRASMCAVLLGYRLRPEAYKGFTDNLRQQFPEHDAYYRRFE